MAGALRSCSAAARAAALDIEGVELTRTVDPRRRHLGIALATAFALVVPLVALHGSAATVSAASCNGASHPGPSLSSGRASPGSGTPSRTIVFTVRYVDSIGCSPSAVEVVIVGIGRFRMSGGTSYASGVTFRFARRLPAGRWSYRFTAVSGSGSGQRSATFTAVSPSRVVIRKLAPPSPKPAPKPTAKPQSKPKPKPTPRPTGHPPTIPSATIGPSASPDAEAGVVSPRPSSRDDNGAPFVPGGSDGGGSGTTGGGDPGESSNAAPFGLGIDPNVGLPVAVWSVTTALGVLVFALGLLPVRRRRDPGERGWRETLAGFARELASPPPADPDVAQPATVLAAATAIVDTAMSAARPPLRFHAPARSGVERRTIAYRFVRVADQPDDTTSTEVARLDRGDEIEVIGEHEGFLKVKTPNGLEGWVQRVVIVG